MELSGCLQPLFYDKKALSGRMPSLFACDYFVRPKNGIFALLLTEKSAYESKQHEENCRLQKVIRGK